MPRAWSSTKDGFPVGRQHGIGLTVGIACFALSILSFVAILRSLSQKGTLFRLDLEINAYMIGAASPGLTTVSGIITDLGNIFLVVTLAIVVGVLLFIRKNWWRLVALFLAVGVGQALVLILKVVLQRPRPKTEMFVFGSSLPSGHVFSATVIYGFCIYLVFRFVDNRTVRWVASTLLALLILLVGLSRIYLGVHWLSDTLAGYATGFAWLLFCICFAKMVGRRQKE